MPIKPLELMNRLELLAPRERALTLVGVPLVIVLACEMLLFSPLRKQAVEARQQTERQQAEVKALNTALAAIPETVPLPGADQLIKQRDELQRQIDGAREVVAGIGQTVNWGTVVRSTVNGTPGLTLTQLKTAPAVLVFSPAAARLPAATAGTPAGRAAAAAPAAARPASAPRLALDGPSIYKHQADLTVTGNIGTLLGYVQTLQGMPGDLRLQRLQFNVSAYPQASIQLTLQTLSGRAETPFN